ncbi:MAG: helix-turn-helix domain-containing protein [Candidatus Magasanikbacteria bacterium]|nr:helix-turn-helix domain-containing protein [Candidatus Magasanikbacteria bacterium]
MDIQKNTSQNNEPKEMIRVSISEAARLFGVNSQTIRRAIAAQEITYVIVSGRYKVNFESLVKWSQHSTTVKNKLANKGIGQFVEKWKIKNPLYSPNPKSIPKPEIKKPEMEKIEKSPDEDNETYLPTTYLKPD